MKQKLSTQDVQAVLAEVRPKVLGKRLNNIYDVDPKTYLLKLGKAQEKVVLLFESGVRFHTTRYEWPKPDFPSNFTMKCRKHLKSRRITDIIQLGVDRILDITFGSDEAAYHLIIELYDKGNVILTTNTYEILALLRVRKDDADIRYAVGERYPVEAARQPRAVTMERLETALEKAKDGDPLRKHLTRIMDCGPAYIEHCLLEAGFPPNARVNDGCNVKTDLPRVLTALQQAEQLLFDKLANGQVKGFILLKSHGGAQMRAAKEGSSTKEEKEEEKEGEEAADVHKKEVVVYEDVMPFPLKQFEGRSFKELDSFDHAVDMYFSEIEGHKLEMKALQQQRAAQQKLEQARKSHHQRVKGYQQAREEDEYKATLIELNHELVNEAIDVINKMKDNQLDWREIDELVQESRVRGDAVANAIAKLKLKHNIIVMKLSEPAVHGSEDDWSDEDDEDDHGEQDDTGDKTKDKAMLVEVDLNETAHGNARKLHERKKTHRYKEEKALAATEQALKSVEKKTMDKLKKAQVTATVSKARTTHWFEKFNWFISSENFLVLCGRDRLQNEALVRRYLTQHDLYVHADMDGASSVVIKNPTTADVPPKTLSEAATFAVVHSPAWERNQAVDAWWVRAGQVSKTDARGEHLNVGSFRITGAKHFIPIRQLAVAFAILFKVDEASAAGHEGERRCKYALTQPGEQGDEQQVKAQEGGAVEATAAHGAGGSESTTAEEQQQQQKQEAPEAGSGKHDDSSTSAFPDVSLSYNFQAGGRMEVVGGSKQPSSQASAEAPSSSQGRRKLTARERRKLKKARKKGQALSPEAMKLQEGENGDGVGQGQRDDSGQLQDEKEGEGEEGEEDTSPKAQEQQQQQQQQQGKQQEKKLSKAKQRKLNRLKGKFDEEDLDLLSAQQQPQGPKLTRQEKRRRRKELGIRGSRQPKQQRGAQGASMPSADVLENLAETTKKVMASAQQAEGGDVIDAAAPSQDVNAEESQLNAAPGEEDEQELAADMVKSLQSLHSLTGQPRPEDNVLYALPVCAPYSATQNYMLRAKLVPGNTKKGRAIRGIVRSFVSGQQCPEDLASLVKEVKDTELFNGVPTRVKVMTIAQAPSCADKGKSKNSRSKQQKAKGKGKGKR